MPIINLEVINKKKEAFQSQIKYYACASALSAAVSVPGLSVLIDVALMVSVTNKYAAAFGLDQPSLVRLAKITGVSLSDLTDVIKSPLAAQEITHDLMIKVLAQTTTLSTLTVTKEMISLIPIIGIIPAIGLSAATTYKSLNNFLDQLTEDAQRVFKRNLDLNTSV